MLTVSENITIMLARHWFDDAPAQEILAWAIQAYRGRIVLACSFGGPTGMVALDMAMRIDSSLPVYVLDTGLLFSQTYELIARVRDHYGIEPIVVKPRLSLDEQRDAYGDALWKRDPDLCCSLRKVEPQRAFLAGYAAWISAIRRDQTADRRATRSVVWDPVSERIKVSPFLEWTEADVWQYIRAHAVPYSELHDLGYPSAGCTPCTRAVGPGEGARDGRWPGCRKTECGLHVVRGTESV